MKISGFSFVRNADKYYFPIKPSILSILPLVDEFVIALGDNDEDDNTKKIIQSINSPKIKIIHRVWDEVDFTNGKIFAEETNFALSQCTGDWCFYLQADEAVHEKDLPIIQQACEKYLNDDRVDGLLFDYYHFWGDYQHYLPFHGYYKNEIRLVKNYRNIYSYKDAQSFRKEKNQKLSVKSIAANIYHYGYVRPPSVMQSKKKEQDTMYHDTASISEHYKQRALDFNYGDMSKIPVFKSDHPKVMNDFIAKLDWQDDLKKGKDYPLGRPKMKHEKTKYQIISFIENQLNGGKEFLGYSNWKKLS